MGQSGTKALYDLHAWIGVALGLALYVVCFSGVVALFDAELTPWAVGPMAAAAEAPSRESAPALDGAPVRAGVPAGAGYTLVLPTAYRPVILVHHAGAPAAGRPIDPRSGEPATAPPEGPNGVMTRLHTDLLLPQPAGRYLVGVLGVVMLVSTLSGLLLHRKALAGMFTLRLGRSRRLFWSDLHKSVGLWGLPFHATMALTGAVLAASGFAVSGAAVTAFHGDGAAAFAAMASAPQAAAGPAGPALPLSVLLERAAAAVPGFAPEVILAHPARAGTAGVVEVLGNRSGGLVYYLSVAVDGATGAVLGITDWSREGFGRRVYAMVTPLHYASYGGVALKALYAVLGAGLCVLVLSGLRVRETRPDAGTGVPARLATAVVQGSALATAGLFWCHALAAAIPAVGAPPAAALFLGLWGAAALWAALGDRARTGRRMLGTAGALLASLPVPSLALAPAAAGPSPAAVAYWVTMAAAVLIGAALLWVARRRA